MTRRDSREEQRTDQVEIGQPTFFVDYAGFGLPGDSLTHLEIYYQVFNFGLQFTQKEGEFQAQFLFTIRVVNSDGIQVKSVEQERIVHAANYEATQSRFDYRTSLETVDLPPGKYTLETTLKDLSTATLHNREFKVQLEDHRQKYSTCSDILFVQEARTKAGEPSVFDKGNMTIVPSVSRFFGGDDSTRLIYYFEIYRGSDSDDRVYIETILRSPYRGMLYRDTMYVELTDSVTRQIRDISLADYTPGDYNLEVYIRGRRAKKLDSRDESFTIQWSQEALLRHDFSAAIEQLRYIASSDEIADMKNLQSMEEKIQAFNAFWDSRDPTLGTRENEAKREFYRRITYANRQFRHLRREGWRTDRGRIYVQFGEPDQIDDHPISPESVPYQIWHYYREGKYRRFTFVDENEDSDYRLQYPYDGLNQRPDF
jgi:GWxTD domain-containing protein